MRVEPIERVYCSGYALRSEVSVLRLRRSNPCGEQKGKALSGADLSLRSSQSLPLGKIANKIGINAIRRWR